MMTFKRLSNERFIRQVISPVGDNDDHQLMMTLQRHMTFELKVSTARCKYCLVHKGHSIGFDDT